MFDENNQFNQNDQNEKPEQGEQNENNGNESEQKNANTYILNGQSQNFNNPSPPPKNNKTAFIIISLIAAYVLLIGLCAAAIFSGNISFGKRDENKVTQTEDHQKEEEPKNPALNSETDAKGNTIVKGEDYTGQLLKTSEIYEKNVSSVVCVKTNLATGSGFIIDSQNGYILTNNHVIEEADNIIIELYNGDQYNATLIGGDSINDVAVLKIGAVGLKSVQTGNSNDVSVGDDIVVIGNPLGELKYTLSKGVVSAHGRDINTGEYTIKMFQIDAAANAGNSGGPAFDATGAVVGIVSAKYKAVGVEGIVFCIPINDALSIASELIEKGYVSGRPNFGVTVSTSDGYAVSVDKFGRRVLTETVKGAVIEAVNKGSCAEKAGLRVGDIVTKLGNTTVTSANELINAKNTHKAGETVSMVIFRDNEEITLEITLDEYIPSNK